MDGHTKLDRWLDGLVGRVAWAGHRLAEALCLFGLCGLFGVLPDLDHVPYTLWQVFPEFYPHLAGIDGRFLHRPGLWALGVLTGVVAALAAGLVGMNAWETERC